MPNLTIDGVTIAILDSETADVLKRLAAKCEGQLTCRVELDVGRSSEFSLPQGNSFLQKASIETPVVANMSIRFLQSEEVIRDVRLR